LDVKSSWEAGLTKWPGVQLDFATFAAYAAERARLAPQTPEHGADLFLACACARRTPHAIDAFERALGSAISGAIARAGARGVLAEEAAQATRRRLFVAEPGETPKIAEYGGRAPLRKWVATVASRELAMLRRSAKRKREDEFDEDLAVSAAGRSVETRYLKARYKRDFAEAVRAAIAALSPKDRALLQLAYANGFTVDRIGAWYQVSRATAARWVAAARDALHEGTRRELCARLGITRSEYRSLAALVRSDLELSVVKLLEQS
jgi:RNA polymerase sigma-70 factor (ECF subfamily)